MKVYLAIVYFKEINLDWSMNNTSVISVCATRELAEKAIRDYKPRGWTWISEEDVQNQIEKYKKNIDLIKRCGCFEIFNDCRKVLEEFEHVVAVEEIEPKEYLWERLVESADKANKKSWYFHIEEKEVLV